MNTIKLLWQMTTNKIRWTISRIEYHTRIHRSFKLAQEIESHRDLLCIELGSGGKSGNGPWLTIDMLDGCDLYWDLRQGIPFNNNTVDKIYSSHFLEHLSYKEITQFMQECLRVLKPGGEFLISVPNAKLYIEAYMNQQKPTGKGWFSHYHAYNNTTPIDYINYMAYMDGHHKYMFDEDNLAFILQQSGLIEVTSRKFDPELDPQWRDFESIYAKGLKPA